MSPIDILLKLAARPYLYYPLGAAVLVWQLNDAIAIEMPDLIAWPYMMCLFGLWSMYITLERKLAWAECAVPRDGYPFGRLWQGSYPIWIYDRNLVRISTFFIFAGLLYPRYFSSDEAFKSACSDSLMIAPIYEEDAPLDFAPTPTPMYGDMIKNESPLIEHLPFAAEFGFMLADFLLGETFPEFKFVVNNLAVMFLCVMCSFCGAPRIMGFVVCLMEFGSFFQQVYCNIGWRIPYLVLFPICDAAASWIVCQASPVELSVDAVQNYQGEPVMSMVGLFCLLVVCRQIHFLFKVYYIFTRSPATTRQLTKDEEVKVALRAHNEPIHMFGEVPHERQQRLRNVAGGTPA